MTRAVSSRLSASVALASSPAVLARITAPDPILSPGDFPADLHGFRRCFPHKWAAFLRAHFHGATHVAAFFDVDHRTARAWLNGSHGANGPVVLFALQRVPGAAAMLLEAA